MWKAWFVVGCSHWYYTLQWHIHLISSEQRAKLLLHFEWRYAEHSWLREWYESDWVAIVCLKQWIFLLPYWLEMHSLHILRLAQCRGRGRAVSFEVSICLFWNNYYLLYFPVKSYMLSFLFHNHLSDQYPAEFGNPFSPIPDEWQWINLVAQSWAGWIRKYHCCWSIQR